MSTLKVNQLLDTSGNNLDRIGQIKFGSTTSQISTTSSSYVQISSALNQTLTPTAASSKFLLLFSSTGQVNSNRARYDVLYSGTGSTLSGANAMTSFEGNNINHVVAWSFLHSPNTTSNVTYTPVHQNGNGSSTFTGTANITSFTVIEILQ